MPTLPVKFSNRFVCRAGVRPAAWLARLALRLVAGLLACAGWALPAAAADTEPSFPVLEFVVEGNTVLPITTVEQAVYPHLGPQRRFADVEAARVALQEAYRAAGYTLASVDIPEQRADTGVIRLVVSEGRVARARVNGARYYAQGYILERVSEAAEGGVPNLPRLQAQLLEVNRNADRRVVPVLRPGREAGTTEIDLDVTDRLPLHGSLTLNNQASRNTSPTRLQAALSYDNVAQRDHTLALQAVVSPEQWGEVQVFSASYSMPQAPAGLAALTLGYTRSDSEVLAGVGDTRLFGKGQIWSLRRSFVLELGERSFQLLSLGAEYKDMVDTVAAGAGAGFDTPIRYLPLSMTWTGAFRPAEGWAEGEWQLGATLAGGLRGLVNRQQQFSDKRYQARAQYFQLRFDARHTRTLPWAGLRLRAHAELQLAPAPLISNEQFVLGGANNVRGYLEAEAVGDQGLRGVLQIASPELAPRLNWPWLGSLSVHSFVDGGLAELRRPLPGQDSRFRLLGAGFGGQLLTRGAWPLNLTLELAWPLMKKNSLGSDGLRAHANASIGF